MDLYCSGVNMKHCALASLLIFSVILLSCTPGSPKTQTATVLPSSTPIRAKLEITHTAIPIQETSSFQNPNLSITQSPEFSPTPTPFLIRTQEQLSLIGTPLPSNPPMINFSNLDELSLVGRWGRGTVLGTAFSPNGRVFVVGSAYGLAVYELNNLDESPTWIGFQTPIYFRNMYFSHDSSYIRFDDYETGITLSFPSGEVYTEYAAIEWDSQSSVSDWGRFKVESRSGRYLLDSTTTYDEFNMDKEYSIREIREKENGELVATLKDETIQITYDVRHEPEGCDLSSFSYCGNVYSPSASLPYKAQFSNDDQLVGILYRPPNLWNSNRYSSLRIYSVMSGELVSTFGSLSTPIEDFSFSPDQHFILIAYVDGAIQVLRTGSWAIVYNSRDFQGAYETLNLAPDYNLIFIQTYGSLEVRSLVDGSLRGRFESPSFALYPLGARFASADADGNIRIIDISTGETVWSIHGHAGKVLSLAFSSDGRYLISASQDCRIKLWDIQTGALLHEFEKTIVNAYDEPGTDSRIFLYYLEFIPGKNQVLGYGSWGTVVSWSLNSGATQYVIQPEALEYYQGMQTLNPHFPEYFGVDLGGGKIYLNDRIYNLETGEKEGIYEIPDDIPEGCFPPAISSQSSQLAFTPGFDSRMGSICVVSYPDLTLIRELHVFTVESVRGTGINWIYPSSERNRLYVTTFNGPILIFQVVEEQ